MLNTMKLPGRAAADLDLDTKARDIYACHMSEWTRTTVYLDAADYRRLKALARSEGRTTAELIREAVAEYTRRRTGSALPQSVAAGRSGRGDLAERAEELLAGMGGEP